MSFGQVDDRMAIMQELAPKLCEADKEVLHYCISQSEYLFSGFVDGKYACTWGLIPLTILSGKAYLWLYHNELVEKYKFRFVRQSQLAVEEMLKEYPTLIGHADANNASGIRWLKWLGARFEPADGRLKPFRIGKENG